MYVGYHASREFIVSSTGDIATANLFQDTDLLKYLDWLVYLHPEALNIAYDLDGFASVLLWMIGLTKEECKQLHEKEKIEISPYRICYFPSKFFAIDIGHGEGHPCFEIINAAQTGYLQTHYKEVETLEDVRSKAIEASNLALSLSKAYKRLGLTLDRLKNEGDEFGSPIKAMLKAFTLNKIPSCDDNIPANASALAWKAAKGSWVDVYKLGAFNAWDWDINGAYASVLASSIPDFTRGSWTQSKDIPDKATHGVGQCIIKTDAPFHPFIVKVGKDSATPSGKYPNEMSLQKLRLMQKYPYLGSFQIENNEGYWWTPSKYGKQFEVYRGIITYLWNMRQGTTGVDKVLAQRLYSGIYGIALQSIPKKGFGTYFCPLIGMTVEDTIHCQLWETCYSHGIIPLSINTDGFITDKDIPLETSISLGGWKLSHKGKVIINSANSIAFEGKDEGASELALKYNWLVNEINNNPTATSYTMSKYAPVYLSQAIAYLGQDFNKLGQIQKVDLQLKVGQSHKRMFFQKPVTGFDLLNGQYDSMPLPYDMIKYQEPVPSV